MRRLSTLLLALVLAGCGDLFSRFGHGPDSGEPTDAQTPDGGGPPDAGPGSDAGVDGGTNDAGNADAGGADAGSTDAGTSDSGLADGGTVDGGNADAGSVDAGFLPGAPFIHWTLNERDTGDTRYASVWGSSATDAYVVGTNGNGSFIDHWDGQSLTPVVVTIAGFTGVWVAPDHTVFAVGDQMLSTCATHCADPVTAVYTTDTPTHHLTAVCGAAPGVSSAVAFAVGEDNNTASSVVWSYNGGSWIAVDPGSTGHMLYKSCWVAHDGSLYVGAQGAVVRYPAGGLPFTNEDPGLGMSANYTGLAEVGGVLYATSDEKTLASRTDAGWTPVLGPVLTAGAFDAVTPVGVDEAFAGGFRDPVTNLAHLFDGGWSYENTLPTTIDVAGVWSPDPRTLFVVGQVINGVGGNGGAALFIGTR